MSKQNNQPSQENPNNYIPKNTETTTVEMPLADFLKMNISEKELDADALVIAELDKYE